MALCKRQHAARQPRLSAVTAAKYNPGAARLPVALISALLPALRVRRLNVVDALAGR